MSQYYFNAEDYAENDQPSVFAARGTPDSWGIRVDETGNKYLGVSKATNGSKAGVQFLPAGSIENSEAYVIWEPTTDSTIALRTQGYESNETRYGATNVASIRIDKVVSGTFSSLANSVSEKPAESKYKYRFRVDGTQLKNRAWSIADEEPLEWSLEVTDSSITGNGEVLFNRYNGAELRIYVIGVGTNGDPAPTAPPGGVPSGVIIDQAVVDDAWQVSCYTPAMLAASAIALDIRNAVCQADAYLSATAQALDGFQVIASVNAHILSAAQASDITGDQPAAVGSLQSAATGNNTVDALSSAAAALSAGAAAGESWTVQAQAVVNLLEQGVAADEMRRQTEDALTAAMAESSQAADQFLVAINALVSLTDAATATDTYLAVVAELASIASGAIASDRFRTSFGLVRSISNGAMAADSYSVTFGYPSALQSGALTSDAWAVMVSLTTALSSTCTADDLMHARATTTARVRAGAVASDSFAIVNAGVRYLIMGAIILRDALQYRVTSKPALNQSVKIKPGH